MSKKRWKITIEYSGTSYSGWQKQDDLPTIQGSIEDAIDKFCQQKITIHGAGRTDTGVHARGQIAHFDLDYGDRPLTGFDLSKALNAHLRPQPISILDAQEMDDSFHARFNAKKKQYCYRILCRSSAPALEKNRMWHMHKHLNIPAMRKASKYLIGEHDFTTFRDSGCQARSPIRTIDKISIEDFAYDSHGGREIFLVVEGQSFLHYQVRNIVGTLSLVGQGKWEPKDVQKALDKKDRKAGGPTAPACGLYLVKINYP